MTIFDARRWTAILCSALFAMLVAGCSSPPSGAAVPVGALAPAFRPAVQKSATGPNTSGPYLYVAAEYANEVLIYPEDGSYQSPVGEITDGVSLPYGLYVDKSGNLYVANQYPPSVTVYAPGSTYPSATYTQDLVRPHYMVVDGSGDLFVSNAPLGPCHQATVVEYQPGSENAYRVLKVHGSEADGVDLDTQGNLYVSYRHCPSLPAGGIEKFSPGSTEGGDVYKRDYESQGLVVDSDGNFILAETQKRDGIILLRAGKRYRAFKLSLPGNNEPVEVALTADQSRIFASSYEGDVYFASYPLSANSKWWVVDQVPDTPQGIALSNGQTF